MITATLDFPRPPTRQTAWHSEAALAGNHVTETLLKSRHASRQEQRQFAFRTCGNAVTESLAVSHSPSRILSLQSASKRQGSPVTAVLGISVFPPLRAEVRLSYGIAGKAVTVSLAFAQPLKKTALIWTCGKADSTVTETIAFYKRPVQHSSLKWASERKPMRAKELCDMAHARCYCNMPGLTPWATIAAAIVTDMKLKGDSSKFKKVGPGLFAVNETFCSENSH